MMNCSATAAVENLHILTGNFGASVFMTVYIGLYGMGLIVYFACQFLGDARDNHEYEIPNEFFSTLRHINEQQDIYNQLTNVNLVKHLYEIYFSGAPYSTELVEHKTDQCSRKYHLKMENLKYKHQYYAAEKSPLPLLTSVVPTDQYSSKRVNFRSFST